MKFWQSKINIKVLTYLFQIIYKHIYNSKEWNSLRTGKKISIDVFIPKIIGYLHVKWRPFKTSLYTMFGVVLFSQFTASNTSMQLANVQRESATYNCPCENTDVHRSRPTFLTDWPCDLFMVIANASWTGNCLLWSGIGRVFIGRCYRVSGK